MFILLMKEDYSLHLHFPLLDAIPLQQVIKLFPTGMMLKHM